MNDFRFATRQLLKNPGFAGVAVLTLALGIGVNSALFSVMYAALFEPLPYPEPDRLVQVQSTITPAGKPKEVMPEWSYPRFELLRDYNRIFAGVAAVDNNTVIVAGTDNAERVEAELASASYFTILGLSGYPGYYFILHFLNLLNLPPNIKTENQIYSMHERRNNSYMPL